MASRTTPVIKSTESEESLATTHEKAGIFTANAAYSPGLVEKVLDEADIYTEGKTTAGVEQWTYWKPCEH